MRARQGPTTELAVPHEAAFAEVLDAHGYLHIPQLAHIEVDGSNPCPAEKDIAGRLHEILSTHHRSEEHTSELQSQSNLVCRLLLEKKKKNKSTREAVQGTLSLGVLLALTRLA